MVLRKLERRNHGRKSPVSIKYQNLRSFEEGLILLCQSILKTRRITLTWLSSLYNPFNGLDNRITALFCKFLSDFQRFTGFRNKTFPLQGSDVLGKKLKSLCQLAFLHENNCQYLEKAISQINTMGIFVDGIPFLAAK